MEEIYILVMTTIQGKETQGVAYTNKRKAYREAAKCAFKCEVKPIYLNKEKVQS